MVMLPFLRESQLQELERRGISGIDLSGNGVVIVPRRLLLYRTGNPNQYRSSAPIKNIYRKNTSMVGRSFLATPAFPTVRAVCDDVNARNLLVRTGTRTPMRIGTVSKAITALEQDLIVARSDGYRLLQADKLLDALADNYEPPTQPRRVRLKVDTKGTNLARWVVDRTRPSTLTWTVTGLSSVGRYAVMAREDTLALYCTNLEELRAAVSGSETDRFPNLELVEADDEPVYFDAQEDKKLLWASPTQCYLELMAGDKRDRETAEQVKAYVLNRIGGGAK
jgi:hypothetical protein